MNAEHIGSFEAKNRLSALLERASRGERIVITRRGKPAAVLGPVPSSVASDAEGLIRRFRALRASARPGPETIRELIDEGRRR